MSSTSEICTTTKTCNCRVFAKFAICPDLIAAEKHLHIDLENRGVHEMYLMFQQFVSRKKRGRTRHAEKALHKPSENEAGSSTKAITSSSQSKTKKVTTTTNTQNKAKITQSKSSTRSKAISTSKEAESTGAPVKPRGRGRPLGSKNKPKF